MDEGTIDREAMGRLAKALVFICGADHPTTVALKAAAESGSARDIKAARAAFLKLKSGRAQGSLGHAGGLIGARSGAPEAFRLQPSRYRRPPLKPCSYPLYSK